MDIEEISGKENIKVQDLGLLKNKKIVCADIGKTFCLYVMNTIFLGR